MVTIRPEFYEKPRYSGDVEGRCRMVFRQKASRRRIHF